LKIPNQKQALEALRGEDENTRVWPTEAPSSGGKVKRRAARFKRPITPAGYAASGALTSVGAVGSQGMGA